MNNMVLLVHFPAQNAASDVQEYNIKEEKSRKFSQDFYLLLWPSDGLDSWLQGMYTNVLVMKKILPQLEER